MNDHSRARARQQRRTGEAGDPGACDRNGSDSHGAPISFGKDYGSFGKLTNLKQERGNQARVWNSSHMENEMSGLKTILAAAIAAASLSACSTLTGAAVGGAAGAAIGNNTGDGDAERGAVIGAAAGAIAGTVADDNR